MQARDYIDSGRNDDAKDKLDEAEKFLDGLDADEKAPIEKQIADLRAKLGAPKPTASNAPAPDQTPAPTPADSDAANITRNLDRSIKMAQEETNPGALAGLIESTQQILDDDNTKKSLSPDARKNYQTQIDALRVGPTSSMRR